VPRVPGNHDTLLSSGINRCSADTLHAGGEFWFPAEIDPVCRGRSGGAKLLRPSAVPWLGIEPAVHLSDDACPRSAQYEQNIPMSRIGVVVERFDAPIALSAHLSAGTQNDRWKLLPGVRGLDGSDKAMPTVDVAQPALAPLLLCGEKALYSPEFHKQRVLSKFQTI
jgi:hypothetical protein